MSSARASWRNPNPKWTVAGVLASTPFVRDALRARSRRDAGALVFDLDDLPSLAAERFERAGRRAQTRMLRRAWDVVNAGGKRCLECDACQEWILEPDSAPKCDDPRGVTR